MKNQPNFEIVGKHFGNCTCLKNVFILLPFLTLFFLDILGADRYSK